jgi:hypothetical protein
MTDDGDNGKDNKDNNKDNNVPANKIPKSNIIWKYSNPIKSQKMATKYFGSTIYRSTKKHKKYMIKTPDGKWVHFGQIPYEDMTKHNDKTRRRNYLIRSGRIRGDWRKHKYSANNLARKILW